MSASGNNGNNQDDLDNDLDWVDEEDDGLLEFEDAGDENQAESNSKSSALKADKKSKSKSKKKKSSLTGFLLLALLGGGGYFYMYSTLVMKPGTPDQTPVVPVDGLNTAQEETAPPAMTTTENAVTPAPVLQSDGTTQPPQAAPAQTAGEVLTPLPTDTQNAEIALPDLNEAVVDPLAADPVLAPSNASDENALVDTSAAEPVVVVPAQPMPQNDEAPTALVDTAASTIPATPDNDLKALSTDVVPVVDDKAATADLSDLRSLRDTEIEKQAVESATKSSSDLSNLPLEIETISEAKDIELQGDGSSALPTDIISAQSAPPSQSSTADAQANVSNTDAKLQNSQTSTPVPNTATVSEVTSKETVAPAAIDMAQTTTPATAAVKPVTEPKADVKVDVKAETKEADAKPALPADTAKADIKVAEKKAEPAPKAETAKEKPAVSPVKKEAPKEPAKPKAVTKWKLQSAQEGSAVIYNPISGDLQSISVGDRVDGLGRVKSVTLVNNRWVVTGTTGKISQ